MYQTLLLRFSILAYVLAISTERLSLIRSAFSQMAQVPISEYADTNNQKNYDSASVANLDDDLYYFSSRHRKTHLNICVPENTEGNDMARFLISRASRGFRLAKEAGKFSLVGLFDDKFSPNALVSALYISSNGQEIQMINLGMLWVGLFRNGRLRSLIAPVWYRYVNVLTREDIYAMNENGFVNLSPYTYRWATERNDILVVTRADLPLGFVDVVKLAVATSLEAHAPLSRIVSNLRAYYNVKKGDGKVFAAMWVIQD